MPDSTPDFDSMSPEELMAWMESLAKRQGASEGFTTAADMQVAEIDPSTVQIDEPGYTPGAGSMSAEKWKQIQEEEAARAAKKATGPLAPPPTPAPAAAAPTPAPAAEAAQPDFDSMSPEELMQWMESLAKRQGASEGFTTTADMQVAEIDPSTVQIDEPGYIPHGMDPEKWKAQLAKEEEAKLAKKTAPLPPPPAPPTPAPAPASFTPEPAAEPAFELPGLNVEDEFDLEIADTALAEPAQDDAMAWLESLAADQSMPQLDLSSLGAELESLAPPPAAEPAAATDPLAWLEGLAQGEGEPAEAPPAPEPAAAQPAGIVADPLESGEDPVKWLETLAKRQGVSEEELVTNADLSIPVPDSIGDAGPGYKEYSFEHEAQAEAAPTTPEPAMVNAGAELSDIDDPETWLDQLASAQGFEPQSQKAPAAGAELSDTEMVEALNKGKDISPDDIAAWMNRQFDRAETVDEEEEAFDPDAPAVKAELPDWLLEQMGTPPPLDNIPAAETVEESWMLESPPSELPAAEPSEQPDWLTAQMPEGILDTPASPEQPALVDSILEPELPDWLAAEPSEDLSIENIFAQEESPTAATVTTTPGAALEVDTSDPWVVAFEEERAQNLKDTSTIPTWYKDKQDTPAPAAPPASSAPLQPAALPPESDLAAGMPEAVPDWLADLTSEEAPAVAGEMPDWLKQQVTTEEEPALVEDLPDWLKEAEVAPQEVPDWLVETLDTNEQAAVPTVPVTAPSPAPAPQPRPFVSPVPVPAAAQIDVAATLSAARSKWSGGDVANSLQDYEAVIRANAQLETVVGDLSKAIEDKAHKENPAIYRVLGDGLMRQGKLQAALDTYRKALNLL